jgi:hypothetical protein
MSDKIKKVVDKILIEKKDLMVAKLHNVQEQILNSLESLADLGDFNNYELPDNLDTFVSGSEKADNAIEQIHKYTKEIAAAVNQLSLINNLLEGISNFCNRAALFLLRDDKLVGWKGKGFSGIEGSITDDEVKKVFFSLSADTVFKKVLNTKEVYLGKPNSQSDDHLMYSRFGGSLPDKVFVIPFFVKGKPQAVIYTDVFGGSEIFSKEIEILATVGEMSLDLLPLKQKILAKVKTQEFVDDPQGQTKIENEDTASGIKTDPKENTSEIPFISVKANDPARKARVIIDDIILYQPDVVKDGLANRNLGTVLKDTLEQAKEEFLRKYDNLAVFEEQLINHLAKGDKEALNGYNFETV